MVKATKKSANSSCEHLQSLHQQADATASDVQTKFTDSLNFDDTVKQMDTLKAILFNTSELNQTNIPFIKEELSAGRYKIHSHLIADKLMEYAELTEQPEMA